MELLDDKIDFSYDKLSVENIQAKLETKREYSKAIKSIYNGRVTVIIVSILTMISLFTEYLSVDSLPIEWIELSILAIYIIAIFIPIEYSKYSFTIISILYLANLGYSVFLMYNSLFIIIIVGIKLLVLYFLVKGAIAGFKITDLISKMGRMNIQQS